MSVDDFNAVAEGLYETCTTNPKPLAKAFRRIYMWEPANHPADLQAQEMLKQTSCDGSPPAAVPI
jgi:hypothetical protein